MMLKLVLVALFLHGIAAEGVTEDTPLDQSKFRWYGQSEGEETSRSSFTGCSGMGFNPRRYVKYEGFASFQAAEKGCKELHANLALLSLDSPKENAFMECLLRENKDAGTFWTSGLFDQAKKAFVWGNSNHPLPTWAPWGADQPPKFSNSDLRVIVERTPFGVNLTWSTLSLHDGPTGFICKEKEQTEPPVNCARQVDVLILIASTPEANLPTFAAEAAAVSQIIRVLYHSTDAQIGVLVYRAGSTSRIPIPFNNSMSKEEMVSAMTNFRTVHAATGWAFAMRDAVREFSLHSRKGLRKNVIFFSDHYPHGENDADRKRAIQEALSAGLHFHPVALVRTNEPNLNYDLRELLDLVGRNANRVIRVNATIPLILTAARPLVESVCK